MVKIENDHRKSTSINTYRKSTFISENGVEKPPSPEVDFYKWKWCWKTITRRRLP